MRSLTFSGSKTALIKMYSGLYLASLYQEYIILCTYVSPSKLFCLHDHTLATSGFKMDSAWSLCVCGEVQKIFGVLVKEVCLKGHY